MMKYIVEESGDFRKGEEGVFNGDVCIFMCPPARLVPGQMEELFSWMKEEKTSIHPLILSSVFHFYLNGNQSLNLFQLKVRLKSFKMTIMKQLRDVM